ncbi:MAG: IS630 family transposase, partial [Acidobacteriaceae bacterium]
GDECEDGAKWRQCYLEGGIDGLRDRYRSGRPGVFGVGQRCELIAIACDDPHNYGYPDGFHWTLDMLADTAKREIAAPTMSRSSVQRTLSEIDLRPHKVRGWLHSRDEHFKEKVNDVVDLYLNPSEGTLVLSIDEMTGVQALERRYETKRPLPGRAGRFDFEYIRHGTTSVITSLAVHTGEVVARCGATRTADDLVSFMEDIAAHYSQYKKIVVIWDNLNIHHEGANVRWTTFNASHGDRCEFHYTPVHASWVNQVEGAVHICGGSSLQF